MCHGQRLGRENVDKTNSKISGKYQKKTLFKKNVPYFHSKQILFSLLMKQRSQTFGVS